MKGVTVKPLFDYVLIKPLEAQTQTASGIVLPESVKEKPQVGEVMGVGPGMENGGCMCGAHEEGNSHTMTVKKGQKVLYKKWAGNEIKVGTEEWLLVQEKDVMAVVEN